jgi:hypothetical protein
MSKDGTATSGRRDFIKLAGLGAAAGSVGLATGIAPAAAATAVPESPTKGYRETDHVKKAYEVARF